LHPKETHSFLNDAIWQLNRKNQTQKSPYFVNSQKITVHKRILIAPLDWGLGHASRCIPLIRMLVEGGAEVIIAADRRPSDLLQIEFPQLRFLRLPGYELDYPASENMAWHMFRSTPRLLRGIKEENLALKKIIREEKINIVISDNRYGLSSDEIKSIFITHQVFIKAPFAQSILRRVNESFINNFSECWIPDIAGEDNLSGSLAHKKELPKNYFFIGPLSRFSIDQHNTPVAYDMAVVLSGPEPQRTILENKLMDQLRNSPKKILFVRGLPDKTERRTQGAMDIVSHLSSSEMETALRSSALIIARSGYSTIMDAARLGKKCIFIPTPGQTEQEYLSHYHASKGHSVEAKQRNLDISKAILQSNSIKGFEQKLYADMALRERVALV
jgi:uncharacterized protein (TIGR00661 family)